MSTEPQPRRPFRTPHWLAYIVVGVFAFLLGAVIDTGTPDCGGYAAPAAVVVAPALW